MRASGILLPISSIPSDYGIGCFSKEAYEFVDQIVKGGQKYWQICSRARKNLSIILDAQKISAFKGELTSKLAQIGFIIKER